MIKGYIIKYDIENNGQVSIGKYVSQDNWGKGETNYFVYYVNGKKLKGNGGRSPIGFYKNTGKFYKILYSKKYLGHLKAFFDQEVVDTTNILKAGFKKEEIN